MASNSECAESCFLGWCLPLTRLDYDTSVVAGSKKDFIQTQLNNMGQNADQFWEEVYAEVSADFAEQITILEKHGVKVFRNFALRNLNDIRASKVFTIFAHYSEEKDFVELDDGLYSAREFVEAIPSEFKGVYDLTACNSIHLRNAIRERYGNQVISFKTTLPATAMLLVYKSIIGNLENCDCNYIDCYTRLIQDMGK